MYGNLEAMQGVWFDNHLDCLVVADNCDCAFLGGAFRDVVLQGLFVDFADRRDRKFGKQDDFLWNSGSLGNMGAGVREQIVGACRRAGVQLNVGHRDFTRISVRFSDGSSQRDRRMCCQGILDRAGIDAVAATLDQFFRVRSR